MKCCRTQVSWFGSSFRVLLKTIGLSVLFQLKKIGTLFAMLTISVYGHSAHGQIAQPAPQRSAQPSVQIELVTGTLRCPDTIVCLKHVARISQLSGQSDLAKSIGAIDLDSFSDQDSEVRISKQQIKSPPHVA